MDAPISTYTPAPLSDPLITEKYALVRRFLRAWKEQDAITLRQLTARQTREEYRLPGRPPSSAMQSILRQAWQVELAEARGSGIAYDLLLSDPQSSPSSQRLVVLVMPEGGIERVAVLRQSDIDRLDGKPDTHVPVPAVPEDDVSLRAAAERVLTAVQQEMLRLGVWDMPRPSDEALAQGGAFGSASMAFAQWLRWVWAERMDHILAGADAFPPSSQLAAYAVREFDGQPECDDLIDCLRDVDDFVNTRARGRRLQDLRGFYQQI